MPTGPIQNVPGSGISKRARLSLTSIPGDPASPMTVAEGNKLIKQLTDWANRLQFGRVGFQVGITDVITIGGVVTDLEVTFDEVIQDTSTYTKTYLVPDLTRFQVPEGLARQYALSYQAGFAIYELVTTTYTFTGVKQTFTVPAGVTEVTVTCTGGAGGAASLTAPVHGAAMRVVGTFDVVPAAVYDVYVGGHGTDASGAGAAGAFPNGGDGIRGNNNGHSGGGSSSIQPAAASFILGLPNALLVAGGGGGNGSADVGPLVPPTPPFIHREFYGGNATLTGASGTTDAESFAGSGATQVAGGTTTGLGQNGAFGQGGNGHNYGGASVSEGGGGGGGWYGGASADKDFASFGGGGGSGKINALCRTTSFTDAGFVGDGTIVVTYYVVTPVLPTDVVINVWVNYKSTDGDTPYTTTSLVVGSTGSSPQSGTALIPLSAGDRIYCTVTNADADTSFQYFTLALWSIGE